MSTVISAAPNAAVSPIGVAVMSVVFFGTLRAWRNIEAATITSLAGEMTFFAAAVVASLLIPKHSTKGSKTAHDMHSGL